MGLYYIPRDDYLMHHGVKGQKWGVRNDYQPTGRRRSSGLTTANDVNQKRGLSKGAKIALGVGAGVAAAGLAAGGGYALYKTGAGKAALKAGSSLIKSAMREAKTTGQAAKAYVQSRNGKKIFSNVKSARSSAKVFQQAPGAKEVTRAARKRIAKEYIQNAGNKVGGIVKTKAKDTASGIFNGLKKAGNDFSSKENIERIVSEGTKKGFDTLAKSAISGGIVLGAKSAIRGQAPNRQEAAKWMTQNPNEK